MHQPLVMDASLLPDLTEYKSHSDKSVIFASRSLIVVFREVNPKLLKRKDRGKAMSMSFKDVKPRQFVLAMRISIY
ncbi:SDA1-domain-containing protein [Jimgerdemannia flammicorona]|uniref:Protein SDA1 n=1 Tax=Jimgerdemannia flammicorona TaxID=994334 RepID=A0A433PKX2_9FUNG|nr:SDA1-domain-containing protein [Jimgerdemannia flammicorona]